MKLPWSKIFFMLWLFLLAGAPLLLGYWETKSLKYPEFFLKQPDQSAEGIEALISWHKGGSSTDAEIQQIISCLMKNLLHPSPYIRASSVKALRWFEAQSAIPALILCTQDPNLEVRFQAIRSLRFLKASGTSVITAYHQRLQEKEDFLRIETILALGQAQQALPETIPILYQLLAERDQWLGFSATWALFKVGASRETILKAMIPALRKRVQQHVPPHVWQKIPLEPTLEQAESLLCSYVKHPHLVIRQASTRSLRWLGKEARFATKDLLESLHDSHWFVRWESAWALGNIQDPLTVPALIDTIYRDPHKSPRENAVWAIANIGKTPEILTALEQALLDLDPEVQKMAAIACVTVHHHWEKNIPILIDALNHEKYYIREFAILALETLPSYSPEVLLSLKNVLLLDDSEMQQWRAFHLLKKIKTQEKKF